jgi:hypothetical protein
MTTLKQNITGAQAVTSVEIYGSALLRCFCVDVDCRPCRNFNTTTSFLATAAQNFSTSTNLAGTRSHMNVTFAVNAQSSRGTASRRAPSNGHASDRTSRGFAAVHMKSIWCMGNHGA